VTHSSQVLAWVGSAYDARALRSLTSTGAGAVSDRGAWVSAFCSRMPQFHAARMYPTMPCSRLIFGGFITKHNKARTINPKNIPTRKIARCIGPRCLPKYRSMFRYQISW